MWLDAPKSVVFFKSFDDFLLNDIEFFYQQEMGVEKINVEKD